jgi:flagella basal body P-ring formation protein FlgA
LARQEDWLGHETTRPLLPGQVLRHAMVRNPQVFAAGDQIKVVLMGGGFQLAASGQALSHGVAGQDARIRLQSGKVVTGTVQDDQTVWVRL